MSAQLDKDAKQHETKKNLLDLQNELVGALKETEKVTDSKVLVGHMDKFAEMFNAGKIASVDEYFLALSAGNKTAATAAADKAKVTKDAAAKEREELYRLQTLTKQIADSAIEDMNKQVALQIKLRGEEEKRLKALFELKTPPKSAALMQAEKEEDELARTWADEAKKMEDFWQSSKDTAAQNSLAVASSLGAMFATGNTEEAGKNMLKTVGNILIDLAESFVLAAAAASLGKAVTTFGASLITDAPWLAAAYAGLEVLRGAVGSFRTGIDYVPRDAMPAILHKGETVLPENEAERWRRGEGPTGGKKQKDMKIHVVRFETAIEGSHVNRARRYS
jgi:hypothetical protein